jgi:hypothetical protein
MSFFDSEFNFESWFVYLILFLSLLLFLLVLHKYYNIFNLLDAKKPVPDKIENLPIQDDNDGDIDSNESDLESNESDPLHITLRAAEMYYNRGDTEKAMELWNTIVIDPLPELKMEELKEDEPKVEELKTEEPKIEELKVEELKVEELPKQDNFSNQEIGLFKFPITSPNQLDSPTPKRDWKTSPSLNAYIQILMKNIKENPNQSNNIINEAKEVFKQEYPDFTLPILFSNVF